MRRGAGGSGRLPTVALACALLAAPAGADDPLAEVRRAWTGLDRDGKIAALTRLSAAPSPQLLAQCGTWSRDEDLVVRSHVVRLAAQHHEVERCRAPGVVFLAGYVRRYLDERRKREDAEFEEVCRKHGRTVPPADQIAAGAGWKDPYDEEARELPPEIRQERAHLKEVLAALEGTRSPELFPSVLRIFEEHHDPEVVVRAVESFGVLGDWRALPPLADLARIQRQGREVGGSHVIGQRAWDTLRLKWDVHKDRLWWSRPEYVPRAVAPICRVAGALTGAAIGTVRELDAWLLAHEKELGERGVRLSADFKARARSTQR